MRAMLSAFKGSQLTHLHSMDIDFLDYQGCINCSKQVFFTAMSVYGILQYAQENEFGGY